MLNAESLPARGGADQPEAGKRRPGLDWIVAWRLQKGSFEKIVVFSMARCYQMLYTMRNCAAQFLYENLIWCSASFSIAEAQRAFQACTEAEDGL